MKINPKDLKAHDRHELMTGMITPRPIAFVSTVGEDGINNLAPYSYFAPLCNSPMTVGFQLERKIKGKKKDTLVNIEFNKEYVINIVTEALFDPMVKSARAYAAHIDEFKEVGLTAIAADLVKAPMVLESPINIECRLVKILEFGNAPKLANFVIGEVVRVHIEDEYIVDGQLLPLKLKVIARLGGNGRAFCRTTDLIKIHRQGDQGRLPWDQDSGKV